MCGPTHVQPVSAGEDFQQGDIFATRLVAPLADDEVRLFRTVSGRLGHLAMEGHEAGRVFAYDDVLAIPGVPDGERPLPFPVAAEGGGEMVVAYADLLEYFVLASQTCDVTPPKPKDFVSLVPYLPLAPRLMGERLPIGLSPDEAADRTLWKTVCEYITQHTGDSLHGAGEGVFGLPMRVRMAVADAWQGVPREINANRKWIKEHVRGLSDNERLYLYYMPPAPEAGVPEGYVDFTRLYTIPFDCLSRLGPHRRATINSPYREQFARKLGDYLSRVAVPKALDPPQATQ